VNQKFRIIDIFTCYRLHLVYFLIYCTVLSKVNIDITFVQLSANGWRSSGPSISSRKNPSSSFEVFNGMWMTDPFWRHLYKKMFLRYISNHCAIHHFLLAYRSLNWQQIRPYRFYMFFLRHIHHRSHGLYHQSDQLWGMRFSDEKVDTCFTLCKLYNSFKKYIKLRKCYLFEGF